MGILSLLTKRLLVCIFEKEWGGKGRNEIRRGEKGWKKKEDFFFLIFILSSDVLFVPSMGVEIVDMEVDNEGLWMFSTTEKDKPGMEVIFLSFFFRSSFFIK